MNENETVVKFVEEALDDIGFDGLMGMIRDACASYCDERIDRESKLYWAERADEIQRVINKFEVL